MLAIIDARYAEVRLTAERPPPIFYHTTGQRTVSRAIPHLPSAARQNLLRATSLHRRSVRPRYSRREHLPAGRGSRALRDVISASCKQVVSSVAGLDVQIAARRRDDGRIAQSSRRRASGYWIRLLNAKNRRQVPPAILKNGECRAIGYPLRSTRGHLASQFHPRWRPRPHPGFTDPANEALHAGRGGHGVPEHKEEHRKPSPSFSLRRHYPVQVLRVED